MPAHIDRITKGEHSKQHLYETALGLMREHGVEAVSMRQLAEAAQVSPSLVYRYFRSKEDILIHLYNTLSLDYLERMRAEPERAWTMRILRGIELSVETLTPHREILSALIPRIMSTEGAGLFAQQTRFVRGQLQRGFERAVQQAPDAPTRREVQGALGRLMYLFHMGVIVFWMMDRSGGQAGVRLVKRLGDAAPWMTFVMQLAKAQEVILWLDGVCQDALILPDDPVYQAHVDDPD